MAVEMRSQKTEILNWLRRTGKITQIEAIDLCKCYRLSARIADLRAEGWLIVTERPRIPGAHYAVYRLIEDTKLTPEEVRHAIYR